MIISFVSLREVFAIKLLLASLFLENIFFYSQKTKIITSLWYLNELANRYLVQNISKNFLKMYFNCNFHLVYLLKISFRALRKPLRKTLSRHFDRPLMNFKQTFRKALKKILHSRISTCINIDNFFCKFEGGICN